MKQKKSFVLYHDYWEFLKLMTDEEVGRFIRAVYMYDREQILPKNLDPKTEMAFAMIKDRLDGDRQKYEKICKRNSEVARIRWQKTKECGKEIPKDEQK